MIIVDTVSVDEVILEVEPLIVSNFKKSFV